MIEDQQLQSYSKSNQSSRYYNSQCDESKSFQYQQQQNNSYRAYQSSSSNTFQHNTPNPVNEVQETMQNFGIYEKPHHILTSTSINEDSDRKQNRSLAPNYEPSRSNIHHQQTHAGHQYPRNNSNSWNGDIPERSATMLPRNNQRRDIYEEAKPRVLAKKTNDANPVAVFGVVADVDQKTDGHIEQYQDMSQRSPTRIQTSQSWQTQQYNRSSAEPSNNNRRPPVPRKPQLGTTQYHKPQNQYRDDSSGYGSGHTEAPPHYLSNPAQATRSAQIGNSGMRQPNNFQRSHDAPTRHWTLRKPSQSSDEGQNMHSQNQPNFAERTIGQGIQAAKQAFDQTGDRTAQNYQTPYPDNRNEQGHGNVRPVPPRPRISSRPDDQPTYRPSTDRPSAYQEQSRQTPQWSQQEQNYSYHPQSQHPPRGLPPSDFDRQYEQQHRPKNLRHETPLVCSPNNANSNRYFPDNEARTNSGSQMHQHYAYQDNSRKHPLREDHGPTPSQYEDHYRQQDSHYNDIGHNPSSNQPSNGYDRAMQEASYVQQPKYIPEDDSTNYERNNNAVQYEQHQGFENVVTLQQQHYARRPVQDSRNTQPPESVASTYAAQEQDDMNYVPDVVKRSYQALAPPQEERSPPAENSHPRNYEEPNSRPTQHPEPQVRQVPMGRDSGRPPSLPAVPRHPYDPVGDDSSPNNTDDSPPPSSKPPGWKQKKFGAFNYFGNLGQPKSTDFSRSSHGQKEASRQPGDGLNADESAEKTIQDFPDEGSDVQRNPLNHDHLKDRLRLAKGGKTKRRPPTRTSAIDVPDQKDASEENSNSDFEITVTANDLAQSRTPPIIVQKPKVSKNKPSPAQKVKPSNLKVKHKTIDETTQTNLPRSTAGVSHPQSDSKLVFKMPSDDVLKRDTAHPVPIQKRVWKVEGFGNTPKTKHTVGSGIIDQIKAVGENALKSGGLKIGDQKPKPRPPPKPSADEVRMERNADAILKSFEIVDEEREERRNKAGGRTKTRGRSRSLDRLSFSPPRRRSASRDTRSSLSYRTRSKSRDRAISPRRRGRSKSRDRALSQHRRGRSRSRDRLSSSSRKGRSKSRDRALSPRRRGRSRSRDKLNNSSRRGRSRSRDRLSSPQRGRSRSRDRLSSSSRRGRSKSRERHYSPHRRGRSKSRDRLHSPYRRGRSKSRDRFHSPHRRGRSKSRDRFRRSNSRDRLSGRSRRTRSQSRGRYSSPGRYSDRDDWSRWSPGDSRYSRDYSPLRSSYSRKNHQHSYHGDDMHPGRRVAPYNDRNVAKRAWVNDPRWRQNQGPFDPRERYHLHGTGEQFPPKPRGYPPRPDWQRNPHYMRR